MGTDLEAAQKLARIPMGGAEKKLHKMISKMGCEE